MADLQQDYRRLVQLWHQLGLLATQMAVDMAYVRMQDCRINADLVVEVMAEITEVQDRIVASIEASGG